ncbi:hypothetical protein [Microbulbifer sp. HZ11]|uniref:hypothetical protein n=1 Tax=Microbulbifer sp. HZ11 TaxID=1453501 RepID=UPI0012DCF315|nr:hypothetical protein [Microbulbifer sp. HZ11]
MEKNLKPGDQIKIDSQSASQVVIATVLSTPHNGYVEVEMSDGSRVQISLADVIKRLNV